MEQNDGALKNEQDSFICYCLRKTRATVRREWSAHGCHNARDLMVATKVGTVCTSCRHDLEVFSTELAKEMPTIQQATQRENSPMIYSRHHPAMSWWKRCRRVVGRIKHRYFDPRTLHFFGVYRLGSGLTTEVHFLNITQPRFPTANIDLMLDVTCYDEQGASLLTRSILLKKEAAYTFDLAQESLLQPLVKGSQHRFGLVHAVLRPVRRFDGWSWNTGSNRPYMSYVFNGHRFSVHEKSLRFEEQTVIPGVVGLPGQEISFALANVDTQRGFVEIVLQCATQKQVQRLEFQPFAAHFFTLPMMVNGERVEQVSLHSSISFSGFQFTKSQASGEVSVQHLVKEGR